MEVRPWPCIMNVQPDPSGHSAFMCSVLASPDKAKIVFFHILTKMPQIFLFLRSASIQDTTYVKCIKMLKYILKKRKKNYKNFKKCIKMLKYILKTFLKKRECFNCGKPSKYDMDVWNNLGNQSSEKILNNQMQKFHLLGYFLWDNF